jgi:ribonuclease BN (tRNA processing enzyme)
VRLTVVGSADAFNSAGRSHSCYLLEGPSFGPIMIDFGGTALMALRRTGREPDEVRGFAITHLHGDHLGGFPFLLIDGMFNRVREGTIDIVGPVRTREKIGTYLETAYAEVVPLRRPFELEITEIAPGEEAALAGATIRGYPADHQFAPERPLSLRVIAPDGRYVAFSGDTAMNDELLEAASGAELFVAECTGMRQPIGKHVSWVEWVEVLPTLGAKRVLFSHLGEDVRRQVPELVRSAPVGPPIQFADDGLVLEI